MRFKGGIQFRNSLWPTYRVDVGNRETTEEMSVVEATLASEMYPAARSNVETASFAQYNPIAHMPEINKPKTTLKWKHLKPCSCQLLMIITIPNRFLLPI